jgi:uncharacterized protein (UPF0332 family)
MDSEVSIYSGRAENELRLAVGLLRLSQDNAIKDDLGVNREDTFYSAAISHAYYAIFYSAKALLLTKSIKTTSPFVHKKTFEEFKRNFVDNGELDVELLKIYDRILVRADELLGLYKTEKSKRGTFTYKTIAQANLEPANESVDNSRKFLINIKNILKKD